MTYAETEIILRLMRLNWPKATLFTQPDFAKLVGLWALSLAHISFDVAQLALVHILQSCRYPPSIAEFYEAANAVAAEISDEATSAYCYLRSKINSGAAYANIYAALPPKTLQALDAIGGLAEFAPAGSPACDYSGFMIAYQRAALQALQADLPPTAIEADGR